MYRFYFFSVNIGTFVLCECVGEGKKPTVQSACVLICEKKRSSVLTVLTVFWLHEQILDMKVTQI